jgi:hypothetical protein
MVRTRRGLPAAGATTALRAIVESLDAVALAASPPPPAEAVSLELSSAVASIGDELIASAALPVGVGETQSMPTKTVEIWWDLDPDQWWTALSGESEPASGGVSRRVASVEVSGERSFSAPFQVPSVPAGAFGVVAVIIGEDGSATSYPPAYVRVGPEHVELARTPLDK